MKASPQSSAVVAAVAALITLSGVGWGVPAHAAATRTVVGQGAYTCQSKPKGLPTESYDVTLRFSLTAPTSVAPGQTVSLSGTATLQFPEKAYQEGKQVGETEADGYSNTLSVASTANGRTTDVAANRWQTPPFPWTDPVVISAPITFHPFTVPATASGSLTLTLPRNERRAPNTASASPASVAFNGVANNKTALGTIAEDLGCYLQGSAPSTIASIPITSTAPAAGAGGSGTSGMPTTAAQRGTGGGGAVPVTGAPSTPDLGTGTGTGAAPGSGASQPGSADAVGQAPGGVAETSVGVAAAPQTQLYPAATIRSGVFVSTNLLILAGGLICFAAVSSALLAQYRLRNLRRAVDDR